jgi:hypothetical protein
MKVIGISGEKRRMARYLLAVLRKTFPARQIKAYVAEQKAMSMPTAQSGKISVRIVCVARPENAASFSTPDFSRSILWTNSDR